MPDFSKFVDDEDEEYDPDDYCVIIGRWIKGGCQEEICGNIEKCPYIPHDKNNS